MSDVFLARQPIYERALAVAGYELLFRDGHGNRALVSDSERATSNVILNTFSEFGLDRIAGAKPAFINVSDRFLFEAYPLGLPPGRVVLELLEDARPSADLDRMLRRLAYEGYTIALDDYEHSPERRPLVDRAQIVKLDARALSADRLAGEVMLLKRPGLKLLAEKVETHETYDLCMELGFDLFQGYFLCRPRVFRGRGIATNKLARLRLLAGLNDPSVETDDLEDLIAIDVGLSLRLLRYINSAFFSLPREIRAIREALVYLGRRNVRRWATIMALAGIDDKPHELVVTSLVRARMCELIAIAFGGDADPEAAFTAGLFSVVDALMDAPMSEVLGELPFSPAIKQALLEHSGPLGPIVRCVIAYERGDLDSLRYEQNTGVSLREAYFDALDWAEGASAPLGAAAADGARAPVGAG